MPRSMHALQLLHPGVMPEVVDIPVPEPGPGQIRLKVAGSGLCHSDIHVIHANPAFSRCR